tara:strand:- start:5926 stop:7368 length:1443 start_codon:yes stop_codon:yes gene_type:complete
MPTALKSKTKKANVSTGALAGSSVVKGLLDQKLNTDLAKIRKNLGISGSSFDPDEPRLHTGLLALDILIGGGIVSGGWYTVFGGEQSAKTTLAMTIKAALIKQKFEGRASYWDYEGSGSPDYIANILKSQRVTKTLSQVFGETDENGEVISEPLVEYVSTQAGEKFFEYYNRLARSLPDKVKIGKDYFYLFENTKENLKTFKGLYDQKYLTKNNKIKVEAEDGTMQAIALLDSYPAMLPKRADKEDGDESLGLQARMFADHVKRIKPYFKQKRITVFGINQVRLRPAVMFGNPEYEPCGETLKFFSDVRIKSTSRALPSGWKAKKDAGAVTEEPSVEYDGTDEYRFIHLRIIKNKLGGFQNGVAWARIWIRDGNGDARGIDPVYDTWYFLKELGWLSGTRNNMKFTENVPLHGAKKLDWQIFKVLILGKKEEVKAACKKIGVKPVDIRLWCKKQVTNGKALRAKALALSGNKLEESSEED